MQSTDTILMIEPIAFGFNAQTAVNNYFQVNDESKETQSEALREFNAFVDNLIELLTKLKPMLLKFIFSSPHFLNI